MTTQVMTREATMWTQAWLEAPLLRTAAGLDASSLRERMVPTIAAYQRWHVGDGPLELRALALRLTRDTDRAEDAFGETYLDVRTRLEGCVERAAAGRSLPGFATVEDVARYHRIQLRLRLQGRWSRRRVMVSVEDVTLSTAPDVEEQLHRSQHALPLRFAACWLLSDHPTRVASKDAAWWWSMLRHSLGLDRRADLGGARNDPTEALDRFRLRMAAAKGLHRWLQDWAAGREGWAALGVELPTKRPDHRPVALLLPHLQDALREALDELDEATPAEREALRRMLVSSASARRNLSAFGGDRRRSMVLAEVAGARAATILGQRCAALQRQRRAA